MSAPALVHQFPISAPFDAIAAWGRAVHLVKRMGHHIARASASAGVLVVLVGGIRPQCAIKSGRVVVSSRLRVAPPNTASRKREWP